MPFCWAGRCFVLFCCFFPPDFDRDYALNFDPSCSLPCHKTPLFFQRHSAIAGFFCFVFILPLCLGSLGRIKLSYNLKMTCPSEDTTGIKTKWLLKYLELYKNVFAILWERIDIISIAVTSNV